MIISKKRFEEEVAKRADEVIQKYEEHRWRKERERDHYRQMRELENRLIAVEKANGIDHPSHHTSEAARAGY